MDKNNYENSQKRNSDEKLLSQNMQNNSQQSSTQIVTNALSTPFSDGTNSLSYGDRHINTISNITTLSPNQSISSAMNAGSSCSNMNTGDKQNSPQTSNVCQQPRLHPKKRKFNPAELEDIETIAHANNSHNNNHNNSKNNANNNNNNNNNTINSNKNNNNNNGKQNLLDSNFNSGLSMPITNPISSIHSDIIEKTNNNINWSISGDNSVVRGNNAIIVTNTSSANSSHISLHHEQEYSNTTLNSHPNQLGPAMTIVTTANLHDTKGSQPLIVHNNQYSQNNRSVNNNHKNANNDINNDNAASYTIVRSDYQMNPAVILANEQQQQKHSQTQMNNSKNATSNKMHARTTTNETFKYSVQQPSIIQIAPASTSSTSSTTNNNHESLELNEWCNHRVLARQEDIYVSGIIKSVDSSNTILVEFDYPEGTQQSYSDVFGKGRFDVISDASPSAGDLILGTRVVCITQTNRPGNVFIEAVITQILNDTKQFIVHTVASDETKTVKRAYVRLLRPPWWDELNDTDQFSSVPDVINSTGVITGQLKSIHSRDIGIYSNTMAGAVAAAASSNLNSNNNNTNLSNNRPTKYTRIDSVPLHHILPTVQVK